jgi:hypothetical protein
MRRIQKFDIPGPVIKACFYTLLSVLSSAMAGENSPITVSSSVDSARIHIGDLIHYSITVIHDDSVNVIMPGFAANLGGFEIRKYDIRDPEKKDGKTVLKASYTISTFFTGDFEIPPFAVRYTLGKDSTQHTIITDKIQIAVESMVSGEEDIRDVKPPLEIRRDWWYTLRWVVAGLGALILILTAVLLYRRWKSGKSLLPIREVPPRPAHETAIDALDQLIASELAARTSRWIHEVTGDTNLQQTESWKNEQGLEIKTFYSELSEILRQYINGRYFVVALEMTTSEVLDGLTEQKLDDEVFGLFKSFLEDCDLVKFARFVPQEELHQAIIKKAYNLVDLTKLIYVEPQSGPEGTGDDEEQSQLSSNADSAGITDKVIAENHEVQG